MRAWQITCLAICLCLRVSVLLLVADLWQFRLIIVVSPVSIACTLNAQTNGSARCDVCSAFSDLTHTRAADGIQENCVGGRFGLLVSYIRHTTTKVHRAPYAITSATRAALIHEHITWLSIVRVYTFRDFFLLLLLLLLSLLEVVFQEQHTVQCVCAMSFGYTLACIFVCVCFQCKSQRKRDSTTA